MTNKQYVFTSIVGYLKCDGFSFGISLILTSVCLQCYGRRYLIFSCYSCYSISNILFSSLALNGGGRIFHSPSSLIFPACSPVLSDLLRDSLCTALQTEKLWIWSTGLSTLLTPSFRQENWVPGNLSALTERSQLGGCVGEVANRVSSGSYRGGHWRYLPIRNHDNRSSADWIRLCPGLSKNSENGNSCPKPHKAAHHDWSSGKSGQHWDWDY